MEPQGSQTETICITEENLLPLVEKHFQDVTAAQWAMLASGQMDPEVEVIITRLLTDIVQTVSTVLLKIFLPKMQEMSTESEEQAVPTIKANLGDSLCKSFCSFFNAEQETLSEAKLLTKLAEEEIEEKVHSYLSEAANQQSLPSKPAIFVNSVSSNIRRLGEMVFQTSNYVKECLSSLPKCGKLCVKISDELSELSTCVKSPESVKSLSESICDIITKWSNPQSPKTSQDGGQVSPPSPTRSAQSAAGEIMNIILDNLKISEDEQPAGSSQTGARQASHFDMTLIVDKMREFIAPSEPLNESEPKKITISKFAQRYFNKMKEDLKKVCKKNTEKSVVNLQDPTSPRPEDAPWDFVLPGSIPEVSKPETPFRNAPKRLRTVMKKDTCEIHFETFKTKLDSLITEMALSDEEFHERFESITRCSEVRNFSEELTDKLYDHLMTGQMYHIPIVPKGKCLSDSVISKIRKQVDGHKRSFYPELLYSMTEDAVGKFVQQILLQMIKEKSEQAVDNENAAGALQEIENLLTVGIPPPEDTKAESESSQDSAPPSHSGNLSQPGEQREDDIVNENEDENEPAQVDEKHEDDQVTEESSYEEDDEPPQAAPKLTEHSFETLTNGFTLALLLRILSKSKSENVDFNDDTEEIQKRLLFLVCPTTDSVDCEQMLMEDNLKDIIEVVGENFKSFGSVNKLLNAATATDGTDFDRVLISSLKHELNVTKRPKKKSKIRRFFSSVGNRMEKAFRFFRKTFELPQSS